METDRLVVGRIVKPHGIRGEVTVEVLSDAPDRFERGRVLQTPNGPLTVQRSRPHQGRLLVTFEEIRDRTQAEGARGLELSIEAEEARALPDGSFYPHQLEGLPVYHVDGRALGTWSRSLETPAHDLWVVSAAGRDVLVPAVREVVVEVDLEARRVVLDPPEGLFD